MDVRSLQYPITIKFETQKLAGSQARLFCSSQVRDQHIDLEAKIEVFILGKRVYEAALHSVYDKNELKLVENRHSEKGKITKRFEKISLDKGVVDYIAAVLLTETWARENKSTEQSVPLAFKMFHKGEVVDLALVKEGGYTTTNNRLSARCVQLPSFKHLHLEVSDKIDVIEIELAKFGNIKLYRCPE